MYMSICIYVYAFKRVQVYTRTRFVVILFSAGRWHFISAYVQRAARFHADMRIKMCRHIGHTRVVCATKVSSPGCRRQSTCELEFLHAQTCRQIQNVWSGTFRHMAESALGITVYYSIILRVFRVSFIVFDASSAA